MKKRVCAAGALFLALAMALPCAPALAQEKEQARKTDHAEPKPVQQGTLTNEKLQRDAMMGVAAKAGVLGCEKITGVQPFVTRMPSGEPGARSWQEMWVVQCGAAKHNVVIDFRESGMSAADWTIRQ